MKNTNCLTSIFIGIAVFAAIFWGVVFFVAIFLDNPESQSYGSSYGSTENAAASYIDSAKIYLTRGEYKKSLEFSDRILSKDSTDTDAIILKSLAFSFEHPDSLVQYLNAVSTDLGDGKKVGLLKRISENFNKYQDDSRTPLFGYLKSGLDSLSHDKDYYKTAAINIYDNLVLSDKARAFSVLKIADKRFPNEIRLKKSLGNHYRKEGDIRQAIKQYEFILREKSDNDLETAAMLGDLCLEAKNKSKAKKYYKIAAELGDKRSCQEYRELTAVTKYKRFSRCCDGSISYSTGRGTCSHHGGVCRIEREPYKSYTVSCN